MICCSVNHLSPFSDTVGEEAKLSLHFLVKIIFSSFFCGKNINFREDAIKINDNNQLY